MKRLLTLFLAAAMLFSCALAEPPSLGLNAEVKPATEYTAQANAAVYDELDFSDRQEHEFATRGQIDAPETLELKDEDGRSSGARRRMRFWMTTKKRPTA